MKNRPTRERDHAGLAGMTRTTGGCPAPLPPARGFGVDLPRLKGRNSMATAVLFIGWNHPHPGHEKEAYGFLMREGSEYIKKLQSQGWFERADSVGLTPHGVGVHGFILLHGERA